MLFTLTRSVRLTINDTRRSADATTRGSGFSGHPRPTGLPRHYQFDVSCTGPLDPTTAYVRNIKDIDQAVHDTALPILTRACAQVARSDADAPHPDADPAVLLPRIASSLGDRLGAMLARVRWRLTPYHDLEFDMTRPASPDTPAAVLLRQRFDFSASHRLNNPDLSAEENRACFGKCNNPAGHGHNYVFEPCVAVTVEPRGRSAFTHDDLETIASRVLVDRFDHKNLNLDTSEFRDGTGVMPSVENIARVSFDLLAPEIARSAPGARLVSITVWETDRTCCTYPG